jgi:hypothetical protein
MAATAPRERVWRLLRGGIKLSLNVAENKPAVHSLGNAVVTGFVGVGDA